MSDVENEMNDAPIHGAPDEQAMPEEQDVPDERRAAEDQPGDGEATESPVREEQAISDEEVAPAQAEDADRRAQDQRLLEALLFASATPMSIEVLATHFQPDTDLPSLLAELANTYAGRGVNVTRVGGGWTFRTAPDLGPRLRLEKTVSRRLSRAAVETLAIIAYHQPVTRAEIEEIRGVALGKGTLDALMESGWIKPGRRRQVPGRPVTWLTTDEFLHHFGLNSLADLPGIEELKAAGLLDARPTSLGDNADAEAEEPEAEGTDPEVALELGLDMPEDGEAEPMTSDTPAEDQPAEPSATEDDAGTAQNEDDVRKDE